GRGNGYVVLLGGKRVYLSGFSFSSRRRHTMSKRDWSSDVCSSDLNSVIDLRTSNVLTVIRQNWPAYDRALNHHEMATPRWSADRSEERRVGKERSSRGWSDH